MTGRRSPRETWTSPRIECGHGSAVTVWQYTLARDLPSCPGLGERIADGSALYSGSSPGTVGAWCDDVERLGHAVTECRCHVPWNHQVIGSGVGHDDARFAESGESMGAYYDSGAGYGGPWWIPGGAGRAYYVPGGRDQVRAEDHARYLAESFADPDCTCTGPAKPGDMPVWSDPDCQIHGR